MALILKAKGSHLGWEAVSSQSKRADQVGLSASKLLIIKTQAALTYVR